MLYFIRADVTYGIYGFIQTTCLMMQVYLIPLNIAAKYRDENSPWEMPLVAMILALSYIAVVLLPSALAPVLSMVLDHWELDEMEWYRLMVVTLILTSSYIISESAIDELRSNRERKKEKDGNSSRNSSTDYASTSYNTLFKQESLQSGVHAAKTT